MCIKFNQQFIYVYIFILAQYQFFPLVGRVEQAGGAGWTNT